jgi:carboxyl-terminal processing protease
MDVMKPFLALLATVALSGAALASPATDLFNQAEQYLQTLYFGPSTLDLKALSAKYRAQLETVCAPLGETCGYEKAEPLLAQMFAELQDGHAYYLSAQAVAAERAAQNNAVGPTPRVGIASVRPNPQSPDRMIADVVEGSPAERVGLRYGDRWTGFNGTAWPTDDAAYTAANARFTQLVRAGETVTMSIVRGVERTKLEVAIKGELIQGRPRVNLTVGDDGIAVLRVKDFSPRGTAQAVHNAVRDAQARGVKGIVLDMRGNSGGLLNEGLETGGAFLSTPISEVLTPRINAERDRVIYGYANGVFTITDVSGEVLGRAVIQNPSVWTGPLVVLVDGNSGSATERVAYYLQRVKRATIIGEPSAGVGNTNTGRLGLVNGGAAAFPTVQSFNQDGTPLPSQIQPDIAVVGGTLTLFETGRDAILEKALETLKLTASPTLGRIPVPNFFSTFSSGF